MNEDFKPSIKTKHHSSYPSNNSTFWTPYKKALMSSQLTLGSLPRTACCFLAASCALTAPLSKILATFPFTFVVLHSKHGGPGASSPGRHFRLSPTKNLQDFNLLQILCQTMILLQGGTLYVHKRHSYLRHTRPSAGSVQSSLLLFSQTSSFPRRNQRSGPLLK